MWIFVAVIAVFLILVFAEYLSRYKGVHSELTRKLVHVMVGTFVAFWPFFLSWRQIQMLSLAFLLVILLSIWLNVFKSIHAVKRNIAGEVLFAMVIGVLAFLSTSEWVFMASMLFLSLADGMAAIVGLLWGDENQYKVFGHVKSVAGSLAFFFTALLICIAYTVFSGTTQSATVLLWLPVVATISENLAVNGTDNLVIPLLAALVLTSVA
jgi:dolichol kinase